MDERAADRIVRVAGRLFAERGYRNVTVRDIAREAGVTHPLIYHHFGSKRALLARVLAGNQARIRNVVVDAADPRTTILGLLRENLVESQAYVLTLTRALLDGMAPADWPGGFPTVERVLELLTDAAREHGYSDVEIRETAAVVIMMAIGWMLLEDQALEVFGLSPADRVSARETLLAAMDRVMAPLLTGDAA